VVLCEHSAGGSLGGGEALDRWDEARAQRSQDVFAQRMEGKLPLPRLRVRTAGVSADADSLLGGPTVEEGDGEGPTAGERNPLGGRKERWKDICRELNQCLTGWAGYFAYDTAYPSFRIVDIHVAARARNFLRRRHKLPAGTARFGCVEVHRDLGVVELRSLLRSNARG